MASFRFSDGAGVPNQREFTNQSIVSITHGLGYFPQIWIIISGQLVFGDITYNNTLSFTVTFMTNESGVIYYR